MLHGYKWFFTLSMAHYGHRNPTYCIRDLRLVAISSLCPAVCPYSYINPHSNCQYWTSPLQTPLHNRINIANVYRWALGTIKTWIVSKNNTNRLHRRWCDSEYPHPITHCRRRTWPSQYRPSAQVGRSIDKFDMKQALVNVILTNWPLEDREQSLLVDRRNWGRRWMSTKLDYWHHDRLDW